ncbi:TetR-like C-terminal domain-containing protein [Actinomycetaceae bacterium MB13-C1-2]|nr:TetR-like C-terminal domain-containing protein [Actinomycetaceae bacterium MB13-C1-2]
METTATLTGATPRRPEDDPRYQRIRARLTNAILELASQKPAEQITVSELTHAAGIARTTFYKHSDSPASFLADYLIEQLHPRLDPLADLLKDPGPDYLSRWAAIMLDVLEHVQENEDVYSHVFTPDGQSVVLSMMTAYFEGVFASYVQEFSEHVGRVEVTELWKTMAISQQVHNTIAMISSWLRTDLADPPERVLETYLSLVPPWQLARFTDSGQAPLRRNRKIAELLQQGKEKG